MDRELIDKIRWCSRVVKAAGMGDMMIAIDNLGTMYNIQKNGRVKAQFKGIDNLVRYCEHIIENR